MVCSEDPDADVVEENAKQWVRDFVSLSNVLEGHQKRCVTPYMHIFCISCSLFHQTTWKHPKVQWSRYRHTVMCIDYNPCCCRCRKEQ